jgi:hypothetical protein
LGEQRVTLLAWHLAAILALAMLVGAGIASCLCRYRRTHEVREIARGVCGLGVLAGAVLIVCGSDLGWRVILTSGLVALAADVATLAKRAGDDGGTPTGAGRGTAEGTGDSIDGIRG